MSDPIRALGRLRVVYAGNGSAAIETYDGMVVCRVNRELTGSAFLTTTEAVANKIAELWNEEVEE